MRNLEAILSRHKPKKKTSKSLYLYSLSYFTNGRTRQAILNDYAAELGMKKPTRNNFEFHLSDVPEPTKEKPDQDYLPGLGEVIAARTYLENISEYATKAVPQACDMGDLKAIIALDTFYQDRIRSDLPPEIQLIRLAKEEYKKDQERIRNESRIKDISEFTREDPKQKEMREENQKRIDEINKEETLKEEIDREEMHKYDETLTEINRSRTINRRTNRTNMTTNYKRIMQGIAVGAISLMIGIGSFYAPSYIHDLLTNDKKIENRTQGQQNKENKETNHNRPNKQEEPQEPDYDLLVSRAKDYIEEGKYNTAKDILEDCMEGNTPQVVYQMMDIVNNRIEKVNHLRGELEELFTQYDRALREDVYTQINYHKQSKKIIDQMDSFKFEGVSGLTRKLRQYENRFERNIERIAEQQFNYYKRRMEKIEDMANDGFYKQARQEYYKVKEKIENEEQKGLFTEEYLGD